MDEAIDFLLARCLQQLQSIRELLLLKRIPAEERACEVICSKEGQDIGTNYVTVVIVILDETEGWRTAGWNEETKS